MDEKLICPVCRNELTNPFRNCPHCNTTIIDRQGGEAILLDPSLLDRSKKYKVHGLYDGVLRKGYTEFYPGDLVELPEDPAARMTDVSVCTYVDGGNFNGRFLMPMRDIAITRSSSGMMMNAPVRYTGPYGERLRCEVYAPENVLGENEPDPVPQICPMGMMGTMLSGMQTLQGMQTAPAPSAPGEAWVCTCGNKNTGKFCAECGLPKPKA